MPNTTDLGRVYGRLNIPQAVRQRVFLTRDSNRELVFDVDCDTDVILGFPWLRYDIALPSFTSQYEDTKLCLEEKQRQSPIRGIQRLQDGCTSGVTHGLGPRIGDIR